MIYIDFILIKPFSEHLCNMDVVIIILEDPSIINRGLYGFAVMKWTHEPKPC